MATQCSDISTDASFFVFMHFQSLDKNCLGQLRKAYCSSLNLLLRREVGIDEPFISVIVISASLLHFIFH